MDIFGIIRNAVSTIIDPLLFGDAVVYRKAKVSNGRGGFTYVAAQHDCRALVIEYTDYQRNTDGIPSSHRQLLINIESLDITFKSDDVIGFSDGTFWRPAVDVGEPSNSILTVQVSTAPVPVIGAIGTGIVVIPNFTFSGTGVATNVGVGAWNFDEFTFFGEGESPDPEGSLDGDGSFTYDFTFEGSGVATLLGSASLAIDEFSFAGSGYQNAIGTADLTYDFTFLGSGYGSNIGSGNLTIDEFSFAGAGVGTLTATASLTMGEFTFLGEGDAAGPDLWTPADLTTPPSFWLDASDIATITKDGSNRVSAWADKSGNANDASATSTHQPLYTASNTDFNNNPTIGPDAAGQGMLMDTNVFSNSYFSMNDNDMVVGDAAIDANLSLPANVVLYAIWDGASDVGAVRINGGSAIVGSDFSVTGAGSFMCAARLEGTYGGVDPDDIYGRFFDATQGSIMDRTSDYARGINAKFAEIIYLGYAPDTTDRQLIEGYLAHKWDLAGNLPSDHPYKSAPP